CTPSATAPRRRRSRPACPCGACGRRCATTSTCPRSAGTSPNPPRSVADLVYLLSESSIDEEVTMSWTDAVRTVGEGDHGVICLHGWFGSGEGWGYLPEVVDTARFTYYFPDLRGYGRRRDETGDHTMWEFASDALELADAKGLERF